jgi:hypothetical protein
MRFFESWWDRVPSGARCGLSVLIVLALPLARMMGHFWD